MSLYKHQAYLPWEYRPPKYRKQKPWLRRILGAIALCAVAGATVMGWRSFSSAPPDNTSVDTPINPCMPTVDFPGRLPDTVRVDAVSQAFAQAVLNRNPVVMSIAVGLDLRTARPLFVAVKHGRQPAGADLKAAVAPQYPFASLAKMLTSSAVLAEGGFSPWSPVYLQGHPHTLYKFQLKPVDKGTEMPLAKAFALSINPVFGRLGVYSMGRERLLRWADTLGFNRPRGLGNGVPAGRLAAPVDSYNIAEVSSGFVRTTLGSPMQAALFLRKMVHDGQMRAPNWNNVGIPEMCAPATVPANSWRHDMLPLLRWTVDSGTARGGFASGWPSDARAGFEMGGKTGSLDGTNPPGRYEWFAGYARVAGKPDSGIAIAVLTVNDRFGSLSASWTAASLLHAWSRRLGTPIQTPVPWTLADSTGRAQFTEADRDAIAGKAWHRPWKPKAKSKAKKARAKTHSTKAKHKR